MAPLGQAGGALGVGHLLEVAQDPPQPRRIQPGGRRHQRRLGRGGDLGGQVAGAVGQRRGMVD
jgi:hypothetical protein